MDEKTQKALEGAKEIYLKQAEGIADSLISEEEAEAVERKNLVIWAENYAKIFHIVLKTGIVIPIGPQGGGHTLRVSGDAHFVRIIFYDSIWKLVELRICPSGKISVLWGVLNLLGVGISGIFYAIESFLIGTLSEKVKVVRHFGSGYGSPPFICEAIREFMVHAKQIEEETIAYLSTRWKNDKIQEIESRKRRMHRAESVVKDSRVSAITQKDSSLAEVRGMVKVEECEAQEGRCYYCGTPVQEEHFAVCSRCGAQCHFDCLKETDGRCGRIACEGIVEG